ncbi:MAG: hypothetical protein JW787_17800 [Sedimentisphaerales bacterium]|nr:hypothetical protein [Sedimentisphaerales bacterium]
MKSFYKQITGWLLLFIFAAAIFFCITAPIELRNAIKSQSWEARDLEILSSRIVISHPGGDYHTLLEIIATDLSNNKKIRISNVKYGDFPITIWVFNKMSSSDEEKYVQKYPAGARVVGYKDTNSERYVLERGDTKKPLALLSCSALWLLGNVYIMIRYPKSRKKSLTA